VPKTNAGFRLKFYLKVHGKVMKTVENMRFSENRTSNLTAIAL